MKLSCLIIICLIVNSIESSAQQLIADSIAKRCRVKSVSWKGNDHIQKKFLNSYTEYYDTNGKITEYLDDFYDSSQTHIIQPNYRELFYYNSKDQLVKKQEIRHPYYIAKEDSTYTTETFMYDKHGRLMKSHSVFENSKHGYTITYSYKKHRKKERANYNVTISKYDNKGRVIEEKRKTYDGDIVKGDKIYYISKFHYDTIKMVDTTVFFKKNDSIKYITIHSYNDKRQLIKQTYYMLDINEKTPVPIHCDDAKYIYDNKGLLIKENGYPLISIHFDEHPIKGRYNYDYTFY